MALTGHGGANILIALAPFLEVAPPPVEIESRAVFVGDERHVWRHGAPRRNNGGISRTIPLEDMVHISTDVRTDDGTIALRRAMFNDDLARRQTWATHHSQSSHQANAIGVPLQLQKLSSSTVDKISHSSMKFAQAIHR